jgi:hypothetical protein
MVQNLIVSLLAAFLLSALPACATPLTYSAKEIRGQIVDAETNLPIEGAVVVAQWVLFHIGPGHGGHKSRIHIHETVTDATGNYFVPAWGPKVRPPMTELHHYDPKLSIFKSGYEPLGLSNTVVSTVQPDSLRASVWDGKVIQLKRSKGTLEEQAFRLSSFFGGLTAYGDVYDWKNYPRMLLLVYAEKLRLRSLGLPSEHAARVPDFERFTDSDKAFLRKFAQ